MNLIRFTTSALLVIAWCPSIAFACTPVPGTDTDAFYRMIALPGRVASVVSVLAAIVWLVVSRSPKSSPARALIALAVLNPGWWLWDIGDCGTLAFFTGGALALLSLVIVGKGLWTRHVSRKAAIVAPGV
jgi:hypothetical protein